MGGWSSTPSAGGGFTGTYGSGTITASTPITFTQTWNNSGVAFTAYKVNVTDTLSSSTSLLADWQVGGASKAKIDKDGIFSAVALKTDIITTSFWDMRSASATGIRLGLIPISFGAAYNSPEIGIWPASGVLEVNSGTAGAYRDLIARNVRTNPTTVSSLTAAATAGAGARSFVTDATAPTFGATVAGGGAVATPVYSDGTNWKVG